MSQPAWWAEALKRVAKGRTIVARIDNDSVSFQDRTGIDFESCTEAEYEAWEDKHSKELAAGRDDTHPRTVLHLALDQLGIKTENP